ncbi:MAG: hypothetical protein EB828_00150 [Nitrosopumilus sp. D6]|nr:MAG: hypothetical protein EB828_00150 [Nitrosopumilus sp. D6]
MANPEVKILRDEVAKIISMNKKLQAAMLEMQSIVDHQKRIIVELSLDNETLKRQLKYYDNPNSPPSHNSFSAQRRKRANRIDDSSHRKPGGRQGHKGVSRDKKADTTERHTPKECKHCGSSSVNVTNTSTEFIDDIPEIPVIKTTCNIIDTVTCSDCGNATTPNAGTKGTSFGPNILTIAGSTYQKKSSLTDIQDTLAMYGGHYAKSTIQNAITALGNTLEETRDEIVADIPNAKYVMMDETPFRTVDRQGYVWSCIGDESVAILVAPTRSAMIPDIHFPYHDKILVCDGYSGYSGFVKKQRCWAHIIRHAEDLAMEGPEEMMLYEKLQKLYHDAKLAPSDQHTHDMLVIRAKSIAKAYLGMGHKFGTTIHNAADDLFTFVMNPGVPPTNNESERALR